MFEHKGIKIGFSKDVYEPDDDTFLIVDNLEKLNISKNNTVLEVGIGSGIVSLFLAKLAKTVTGVDINKHAVELSIQNAVLNNIKNVSFFESDLFDKIDDKSKFDLIIFNLPYVPTEEIIDEPIAKAWDGGANGRKVTDRFLSEAINYITLNGKICVLDSSLSNYKKTILFLENNGFKTKIIAEKKLSFEMLYLIEGKHINRQR
ncbi:methyltransferase domain-containing protein [archaeon]|nr:methyltransferase domain-containing protein [archaeon]